MFHYLKRALNILVLGVVYIRINVFSLLYWFVIHLTQIRHQVHSHGKGIPLHACSQSQGVGEFLWVACIPLGASLCMREGFEANQGRKDHVLCEPPFLGGLFR